MIVRQDRFVSLFTLLFFLAVIPAAVPPVRAVPQTQQTASPDPARRSKLQSRAEQGDPIAQYQLAKSLLVKDSSAEEIQAGLRWLRASALQKNPNAELFLGYLYEHGQFVPVNYALARENYEQAALHHSSAAENNIASLYQHGQGVPKNLGKAFDWYLASAQHGDPIGQLNLATLYYLGSGTPRDYGEALRWMRASADSGFAEAQNNLACFYFLGIAVQRDYPEAARLVRLAAEQSLPGAEINLAYLYEVGKGVPLDYVAAYTWYSRAIAAGDHSGAERRKELARLMTPKQRDEANALVAAALPGKASQGVVPVGSFSLIQH